MLFSRVTVSCFRAKAHWVDSSAKYSYSCHICPLEFFIVFIGLNRPFPSSPGPLYQNEVKRSAVDMKMIFHFHANKTHFTRKVVHLASFWKWGFLELWSGLFHSFLSNKSEYLYGLLMLHFSKLLKWKPLVCYSYVFLCLPYPPVCLLLIVTHMYPCE